MKQQKEDTISPDISEETRGFLDLVARILLEQAGEKIRLTKKLEEHPGGFHFDKEGCHCAICQEKAYGPDSWYDQYGLKCITCQEAIDKRIIPAFIAKDSDSYYTDVGLQTSFNMDRKIINAFVKTGLLKAREIPARNGKGRHLRLFLLKDNRGFLPPHKVLRNIGGPAKEINKDGRENYVFYPWYRFVNPVKHLAKYGISDYMRWE